MSPWPSQHEFPSLLPLSWLTLHSFGGCSIPCLEHGDANVQHDPGAQILACVFHACSAEPQSHPNARIRRSTVLSLGTWPLKSTNSELLFLKAKGLPSCCTILTSAIKLATASVSVATTTSSSTKNFVLAANRSSRNQRVDDWN